MVGGQAEAELCERLRDASNVFLLAPTFSAGVDEQCHELLECGDAVLYVVTGNGLDEYRDKWVGHDGPSRVGVISLGGPTRSASPTDVQPDAADGVSVEFRSVESPGNLTKIGVELNGLLSAWTDEGIRTTVCFESLTPLIQYSDVEKVYKFLHVFSNQVEAVDALAHYHLDPNAHDGSDVNLLMTTFDAVVEVDPDGDVSLQTR